MAKFRILREEEQKKRGKPARKGITLSTIAHQLQIMFKKNLINLDENLEHVDFKPTTGDEHAHLPAIVLNYKNKNLSREIVFKATFGGTTESGFGEAEAPLLINLLNWLNNEVPLPEGIENRDIDLEYNFVIRGDDKKIWVKIDSPKVETNFILKVNGPKGTGGVGRSGLNKTDEREIAPIIHAYRLLWGKEVFTQGDKKLLIKFLGIDGDDIERFDKFLDPKIYKKIINKDLIEQGHIIYTILSENKGYNIYRGKSPIYNGIRNQGLEYLKSASGLEELSKVDKYTPADMILSNTEEVKSAKTDSKNKGGELFKFNSYFANDLLENGTIGSVKGFPYIGISQKQNELAQGGGGKMFFTVVNKNIYSTMDNEMPNPLTLDWIKKTQYPDLNRRLKNMEGIKIEEKDGAYLTFGRRRTGSRGQISQNLLKGKYRALKMLEFIAFGNIQDIGEAIYQDEKKEQSNSFLKLIEYSMCAGTTTKNGKNSVYVYPCFYKLVGGKIQAYNNTQLSIMMSKDPVNIIYNANSITLTLSLIMQITGTKKESKPIPVRLPFIISGDSVQPIINNIGEAIFDSKQHIQNKISEFLNKLDQFK